MIAQYDLKPGLSPQGKEGEQILYPKLVAYGTKDLKDILKHASMHTGLNAATVQGVVTFLEDVLAEHLASGYNVKLTGATEEKKDQAIQQFPLSVAYRHRRCFPALESHVPISMYDEKHTLQTLQERVPKKYEESS